MGNLDPNFSGSVFRQDWPAIIAMDRFLAKIMAGRFAYNASGLHAGQVVGRVTSTGYYVAYDDAATGGQQTAVGVLLDDLDFSGATGSGVSGYGSLAARIIVGGAPLYYDNLTGIDAAGLTDLKARVVVDAGGTNLMVW